AMGAGGGRRDGGAAGDRDPVERIRLRARALRGAQRECPRSELGRPRAVGSTVDMNVLITGISGYIGSRLAPRLAADGHEVRGLSRRPAGLELPYPVLEGDAVS